MDFPSALFSFLAGATARSLVLALLAFTLLAAWRGRSAAARHAVLFLVAAGMLALAALTPLLPALPLPILHASPDDSALPTLTVPLIPVQAAAVPSAKTPAPAVPLWPRALAAIYFAGVVFFLTRLLFGALFTRRLVRGARPVERAFGARVYESSWISVPLTVGWLRPRILLPAAWQLWDQAKLDAVLAHERTHIRRGDWPIGILAAVNRSLFWFNPLAWWLERRLSTLAEQACDDAALLALGERDSYAQALLDMAAAVKTGQGRLVWEAMAMARGKEVRMRIERILDDNRQIPRGLTRSWWLGLVACSLPLIYFTAVLQPVPAQAQNDGKTPPAIAELLSMHRPLTASDAMQLEQHLAANPGDLQTRMQLILYYFSAGVREPRLTHIYWLIANHPESTEAVVASSGITPRATSFNTTADYDRAAGMWRQQAAAHSGDGAVLLNAAQFFSQPGGNLNEAERVILEARSLQPPPPSGADRLAKLYTAAILATSGDPKFPDTNPEFSGRVRTQIENSTDGMLLLMTGRALANTALRLQPGEQLPPNTLNLDEHPLLIPIVELGRRLLDRAEQFGGHTVVLPPSAVVRTGPGMNAARDQLLGATQAAPALPKLSQPPALVSSVPPVYPPLAQQARIQGTVRFNVAIDSSGHPTNLTVVSGHPLLVQAALEAVKQWVWSPVPQTGTFQADVNFSLPPGAPPPPPLPENTPRKGSFGDSADTSKPPVPQRIRVGGNVQAAMLVNKVEPVYPEQARAAGIEGSVTLAIIIGKDGTVQTITPVDGHPLLLAAAQTAIKQWVYKTTLLNGEPVEVGTTVTLTFNLNQ